MSFVVVTFGIVVHTAAGYVVTAVVDCGAVSLVARVLHCS